MNNYFKQRFNKYYILTAAELYMDYGYSVPNYLFCY